MIVTLRPNNRHPLLSHWRFTLAPGADPAALRMTYRTMRRDYALSREQAREMVLFGALLFSAQRTTQRRSA